MTITVTLVGWVALLKGIALLIVPPATMARTYKNAGLERFYYVWMGAVLLVGIWMTATAFKG